VTVIMYAAFAFAWSTLASSGEAHPSTAQGCSACIPLFETEQQARDWAGDEVELMPVEVEE
jgi:hypothetical protein